MGHGFTCWFIHVSNFWRMALCPRVYHYPPSRPYVSFALALRILYYLGNSLLTWLCSSFFSALSTLLRIYLLLWLTEWRKHGIRDIFAGIVKQKGRDTVAILHEDTKWTYGEVDDFSNRFGNFLVSKGYKPQTNIALFMENEPKYIGIWLGAAKVCFSRWFVFNIFRF